MARVERITPQEAHARMVAGRALLVCAYATCLARDAGNIIVALRRSRRTAARSVLFLDVQYPLISQD